MRFAILQSVSVVIAVMGLTTNSAAVVIGAMLVAPLMAPIMGVSASLAMGWGGRAGRTAMLVSLAAAGSVALAYLLNAAVPGDGITEEVLARTAPGATDLVIALAAGLAGAYATVRPDISASLPGVAVAVALVPPLATIGVTWQSGENGLATGALLLFVTNLAAIVFAGLVVFPLTGFVPVRRMQHVRGRVLFPATGVTAVVVLLTALLTNRSIAAANQADHVASTRRIVLTWLTGTGLELTDLAVHGDQVTVDVAGPDAPPDPSELARQLAAILGPETELEVQWLQRSSIAAKGENGLSLVDPDVIHNEINAWLAETGEDPNDFTVEVDLEPRPIVVAITGPAAPPDQRSLERRLSERLSVTIPVTVDATVSVPDVDTGDDLETAADVAAIWAAERGLSVSSTAIDGDTIAITVEGPTPPSEAATLQTRIRTELRRTIELRLQHRTVSVVPSEPEAVFHWPIDCAAQTTAPAPTPATRSFTATPLGTWLNDRLATGPIAFTDDGSSFARDYADGTLHVWASPVESPTTVQRREVSPAGTGPRDRELRYAPVGPVAIWAVVEPHDVDHIISTTCLPSTAALDNWFANLINAASAPAYAGALDAYRPVPAPASTPARHLLRVAAAAQIPLSLTIDGELSLLVADSHVPIAVTNRIEATDPTGIRTRAGGLTIDTQARGTDTATQLDHLAAALAVDPYIGQPARRST